MTAGELVASKKHILLDFDGPICAAFAGYGAVNISRRLASFARAQGVAVPPELSESADPFEFLRFSAISGDLSLLGKIDAEFRKLERVAVQIAPPTIGAEDAVVTLGHAGHTITVVSNNSAMAVVDYLERARLFEYVDSVEGRLDPDPSLLKPNPHLVLRALHAREARATDSVLVGDSVSDIQAARLAGISSIALVNKPGKRERLAAALPDMTIEGMRELILG